MPVNEEKGYVFEFNGSAIDNCSTTKVPNSGITYAGIDVDSVGNGALYVTVDTSQAAAWGNLALRLSNDNCDDYSYDMSDVANQRLEVKIKTSVAMKEFKILLGDADGAVNDSLQGGWNIPAGADTILTYESINFNQWAATDLIDSTTISNLHIYFRDDYATQVAGAYVIDYIKLGSVTVVGTKNDLPSTSIVAYPNPATTQVNFETTLENVTIYNVVGLPVYEAQAASSVDVSSFDSGVYFIQHAAGTTRFTVQ